MAFEKFRLRNKELQRELLMKRAENAIAEQEFVADMAAKVEQISDPLIRDYLAAQLSPSLRSNPTLQKILASDTTRKPGNPAP
jgi:hypothetical protein